MMSNSDIRCAPAPEPAAQASSDRTENIEYEGGGRKKLTGIFVSVFLLMALLAVTVFVLVTKYADGDAVSPQRSAEIVALATVPDGMPAECVGDIADSQLRWYCQDFLPFAQKAVADHGRIDRLEAMDRGSGMPRWVPLVLIVVAVLTVLNTLLVVSMKKANAPDK